MDERIAFNIKAHNKVAEKYESHHTQIFNSIEQNRISDHIRMASEHILTKSNPRNAFDFGCGSGNLTRHLLAQDFKVTAADVASGFLKLVESKYPGNQNLATLKLNGTDLSNVGDNQYDLVVAYAVLHHIPDYLSIIHELVRITKPGGILIIDREAGPSWWNKEPKLHEFMTLVQGLPQKLSWTRFFSLATYVNRWKIKNDPRYQPEGDIHIWPDDHIEWEKIKSIFAAHNFEIVWEKEYLSFDSKYPEKIYLQYKDLCADDMLLVGRKKSE